MKQFKNKRLCLLSAVLTTILAVGVICSSLFLTSDAAMATGKSKWVGNIWYDSTAPTKFADYWNQITPENATKWASCEPSKGTFSFGTAKTMYNYCQSNGIPFKFHTLIWGAQYPSWVDSLSSSDRKTQVENWIKTAGQNFPNAAYVDVVNEAMPGHNPPSWKNDIGGDNGLYGTGWDWIVWSFEKARQYFPNSKLLINDYNVLCDNYSCIDTYLQVINILKARGLIDGIGCQSHGLENSAPANVKAKLDRLAATGLPVYISEFDLNIADDTAQKNKMQALFPVFFEHPDVKGITLWGYAQGHTWLSNSYLLNSNGTERPALTWLKQYLAAAPSSSSSSSPSSAPSSSTPSSSSPTSSAPSAGGSFKVQLYNGSTTASTSTLSPNFRIINTGTAPLSLSGVKIRYYFTSDGTQPLSFACDWSTAGSSNVTDTFAAATGTNTDHYCELGFTSGAGTLAAGASCDVQTRIWKTDWSAMSQSNDYSFNSTASAFADWTRVTGYLSGALQWGAQP